MFFDVALMFHVEPSFSISFFKMCFCETSYGVHRNPNVMFDKSARRIGNNMGPKVKTTPLEKL